MTINAIRDAINTEEVFTLLAGYVELAAARGRGHLFLYSPLALASGGSPAVRVQLEQLLLELDAASRNLDDYRRDILHEAVHVFGAALEQLVRQERMQHTPLAA